MSKSQFNFSVLESALDNQLNSVAQKLANQPNELLLRCIKKQQGDIFVNFSQTEVKFLSENFIAKIYYGEDHTCVDKFLPPWDGYFKKLASKSPAKSSGFVPD